MSYVKRIIIYGCLKCLKEVDKHLNFILLLTNNIIDEIIIYLEERVCQVICTAEKIEVQPRNAADSQETDCATFIPENKT